MIKTLGRGSYGHISLCRRANDELVHKELLVENEKSRRLFAKEAKLLNLIEHENIVKFDSICIGTPTSSFLIEYVKFDFGPFGQDTAVSSLGEFLKFVDGMDFENFENVNQFIANDICKGLRYLHDNDIVHRDLKPDNVLVSNQHYSGLTNDEVHCFWSSQPIVAKLTDFGESRATLVQTSSMLHTGTSNVGRGSLAFMAPEIHSHNGVKRLSIAELKAADMWAFAMTMFMLVNPDFQWPYEAELNAASTSGNPKPLRHVLLELLVDGQLPTHGEKYSDLRATAWRDLMDFYSFCAKFTNRPTAAEALYRLNRGDSLPRDEAHHNSVPKDDVDSHVNVGGSSSLCGDVMGVDTREDMHHHHEGSPTWADGPPRGANMDCRRNANGDKRKQMDLSTDDEVEVSAPNKKRFQEISQPPSDDTEEANTCRSMHTVLGDFHQATADLFNHGAAGTQCCTISLMAIVAASIKSHKKWTNTTINDILLQGDNVHTHLLHEKGWPGMRKEAKLDVDEMPQTMTFQKGGNCFEASMGVLENSVFGFTSQLSNVISEAIRKKPSRHLLLRMYDNCTAILFDKNTSSYSVFDPHARNAQGYQDEKGAACVMHFDTSQDMINYLQRIVTADPRESQIDLTPVDVVVLSNETVGRESLSGSDDDLQTGVLSDGLEQEEANPVSSLGEEPVPQGAPISTENEAAQEFMHVDDDNSSTTGCKYGIDPKESTQSCLQQREHPRLSGSSESSGGIEHDLTMTESGVTKFCPVQENIVPPFPTDIEGDMSGDIGGFENMSSSARDDQLFPAQDESQNEVTDSPEDVGDNEEDIGYFCDDSYWHKNKQTPVYELHNKMPYSMKDVCNLLLSPGRHENKLCSQRPLCVRQDAVFLIDLNHVDQNDIRADGNGTYKKELRHYRWVVKHENGQYKRKIITDCGVKDYALQENEYFLHWNTYAIPEQGLRRQINWLTDKNESIVNEVAFLQYTLPAHVTRVHFVPKHHGNSKSCRPFPGRLAQSTLEEVKEFKSKEKPSTVVRDFQDRDPLMADPCSIPSPKSIYNCRYVHKTHDPLQELLDFNEELAKSAIIGQHGCPGITIVFQTDYMSQNARFLDDSAILQVDTTFGQHNFYVTVVTTQDKSMKGEDGRYPWVMLAMAFHENKSAFVHELIVHDIVEATTVLKQRKAKPIIITDAETGLWKAWEPHGKLLRCCNHLQQNFKHYLMQDLHIPKGHTSQFIGAVFCSGGLIDSEDGDAFMEGLESLKEDFDVWEATALNRSVGNSSKAYSWLGKRSEIIINRVLRCARRKAGFPEFIRPTTNGVEAFNHRLKQVQEELHARSRKLTFVEYFSNVILLIEKDMDAHFMKALIGQGRFDLSQDYQYLKVPLVSWTAASPAQKVRYLKALKSVTPKDAQRKKTVPFAAGGADDDTACTRLDVILPHECIRATLVQRGLPTETVQLLITRAENLLNGRNHITQRPTGNEGKINQYLVHSHHSTTLQTCTVNQKHVTCDCRGFKSKTVCQHNLAVAYKVNLLMDHLEWLRKQPVKGNKTALISQKKAGSGQKGHKQKSKPRPARDSSGTYQMSTADNDYKAAFTKCYHNNDLFTVIAKDRVRQDRYKCWHCNISFEDVIPGPPDNIAIWHRGAWEYPEHRYDPSSPRKISSGYTDYYYHVKRACIRGRYPYFLPSMVQIDDGLVLNKVQRDLLARELGYTI